MSATALHGAARRRGVDVAPGTLFTIPPALGERFARLNFAARDEDEIDAGVRRLAAAIDDVR